MNFGKDDDMSLTTCRSQIPQILPNSKRKENTDEPLWKMLEFKLVNDEVAQLDEMNFLGLLCKVRGGQDKRFLEDAPHSTILDGYWEELEIFRCADGCETLAKKMAEKIDSPAQFGGHPSDGHRACCFPKQA